MERKQCATCERPVYKDTVICRFCKSPKKKPKPKGLSLSGLYKSLQVKGRKMGEYAD